MGTTPTNPGSGNVQDPHQHTEGAINPMAAADTQTKTDAITRSTAPLTDAPPKNS